MLRVPGASARASMHPARLHEDKHVERRDVAVRVPGASE